MKKQPYLLGLAAITALTMSPFNGAPLLAKAIDAGSHLAENVLKQPKVVLQLSADQQVMQTDKQGQTKVTWQALTGQTIVQPGAVLRYSVKGENQGDRAAKNLAVTQPIPPGTVYVLNSAAVGNVVNADITYSIDNAKTFVAKPVIKITLANGQVEERPAPADAYTHVQWRFNAELASKAVVKADYQVKVRS
jgi:uncharacterized repeat protein (TIGR01451 family)